MRPLPLLCSALLASAALAQAPAPASAPTPLEARPGEEVMEERWIALAEIPDDYFRAARANLSRDRDAAAEDLRKAIAILELRAEQAPGASKQALTDAIREVRQLERGLEQGSVKSLKQLSAPIARAEHALAQEHHLRASEAWSAKENLRAGHELRLTAQYTEQAAQWSGREAQRAVKASVRDTRKLADALVKGASSGVASVDKGLQDAGKSVEQLAQWTRSGGAAQQGTGGSSAPEPQPQK